MPFLIPAFAMDKFHGIDILSHPLGTVRIMATFPSWRSRLIHLLSALAPV